MTLTAIVTPFFDDYSIDYLSFTKLLKLQFESSVDGIVALGSTAETIALKEQEQEQILNFILDYKLKNNFHKKVFVGVSSSSTVEVLDRLTRYNSLPIDGYLLCTPAYNKPQQQGLINHFVTCCDATTKPVIMYNVPGRTGINMDPNSYVAVAKQVKNKLYIKEANDNSTHICNLFLAVRNAQSDGISIEILSGNDDMTPFFNQLGGRGLISVLSNLEPNLVVTMANGDIDAYFECLPKIKACFEQTNPVPIKNMLYKAGIITTNQVRMPLLRM